MKIQSFIKNWYEAIVRKKNIIPKTMIKSIIFCRLKIVFILIFQRLYFWDDNYLKSFLS